MSDEKLIDQWEGYGLTHSKSGGYKLMERAVDPLGMVYFKPSAKPVETQGGILAKRIEDLAKERAKNE